jgi:hypothetical protein
MTFSGATTVVEPSGEVPALALTEAIQRQPAGSGRDGITTRPARRPRTALVLQRGVDAKDLPCPAFRLSDHELVHTDCLSYHLVGIMPNSALDVNSAAGWDDTTRGRSFHWLALIAKAGVDV